MKSPAELGEVTKHLRIQKAYSPPKGFVFLFVGVAFLFSGGFFFLVAPTSIGSSWARDRIRPTAATQAAAQKTPDP